MEINHPPAPAHKCGTCDKTFNTVKHLNQHQKIHHQPSFNCTFCGKDFIFLSNLNRHVLGHIGERSFWCDVCEMEFITSEALKRHKKQHNKVKPFKCPHAECSKRFTTVNTLYTHIKKHNPKLFDCFMCSKSFASKRDLLQHVKYHLNEKPFFCSICDEEFSRNYKLKRHLEKGECRKVKEEKSKKNLPVRKNLLKVEETTKHGGVGTQDAAIALVTVENPVDIDKGKAKEGGAVEKPKVIPREMASTTSTDTGGEILSKNSPAPGIRICLVCGETFCGEKAEKKFAMHVVAEKHYLIKKN
ncbi:unnamed protein product [Orchesella dallaii]|uniref:C2H2-type domain-containing protein n=1 Tax=Orchesella dallaii TaxID=48710 RepID=A0ABP1R2T2_9HEXA